MEAKQKDIIPVQEEGADSNTTASYECNNETEARSFFKLAKERLLNVNEWESIAGFVSADFRLCDEKGNEVSRAAQPDDHFKIDVPGPGPVSGDGYDWVKVEAIEETETPEHEFIGIKVRPCPNPLNNDNDIAHFFSDSATSTFIVERKEKTVTAAVHGRNEKPNADADHLLDKARNSALAIAAITAFSKIQWKGLVEGIVKE